MWFDVLLPKLVPYLRKNGGPVLMVQLENEYGSYYACDQNYTSWLSALIQSHFGKDIVQYTSKANFIIFKTFSYPCFLSLRRFAKKRYCS